jgi:hypothetical protein
LHSLSGDEVLDDAEDALLLIPGELADFFEKAPCLAGGPPLALTPIVVAEEGGNPRKRSGERRVLRGTRI